MCLCYGKTWKSNVNNIYHIPCWPVGMSEHVVLWGVSRLRNHLPDMPANSRQWDRQNIKDRTHTWQQCSVTTSEDILTTKYGFNLRQNSPLSIDNNTGYSGWIRICCTCANRSAITQVGTLLKRHTLVPSPTAPLYSIAWLKRAGETVLNATVPTGDHRQVEFPARGYCTKNSAYINKTG